MKSESWFVDTAKTFVQYIGVLAAGVAAGVVYYYFEGVLLPTANFIISLGGGLALATLLWIQIGKLLQHRHTPRESFVVHSLVESAIAMSTPDFKEYQF